MKTKIKKQPVVWIKPVLEFKFLNEGKHKLSCDACDTQVELITFRWSETENKNLCDLCYTTNIGTNILRENKAWVSHETFAQAMHWLHNKLKET